MTSDPCPYCRSPYYRRENLVESRRLELPDGTWCHYGCFVHWLVDDALRRHCPGISDRERLVMRLRLGLPRQGVQHLKPLVEVGSAMGWTGTMRASQVQNDVICRFEKHVRKGRQDGEVEKEAKIHLNEAASAAEAFLAAMSALGVEGKK
jgi:hypothetical protein